MDAYQETYKQEAEELLTDLEEALLELEDTPDDLDLVARAFRAMHTIKGSGAMFGFDDIASFTHDLETVFDKVRNGELSVTRELVDVGLQSKDHIRGLLSGSNTPEHGQPLLEKLKSLSSGNGQSTEPDSAEIAEPVAVQPEESAPGSMETYRIRFIPNAGILGTGANPLQLLKELHDLGNCEVAAHTGKIPRLKDLDPESCWVSWDIICTTDRGANAIRDVFLFVEDHCELKLQLIDDSDLSPGEADYKKLGDILVERGDLTLEEMREALASQKRFGQILEEQKLVEPSLVQSALAEQSVVRQIRQQKENNEAASSIRVPAAKLDALVDLVGELVIAQARLNQISNLRTDAELTSIAEEVERLTAELRDNTLNIRMLPIGSTFGRFRRLVRDLSSELGKEVVLTTEGAETELDKTVIERLGDPLVHIIRNSIDHGIRPPEERKAAGKPPQGTIKLAALHSGANVIIEVSDDGAGLDPEAIRAKAIERGLITADAQLPEQDLFNLVMLPGFSTARKISSVSGRGVGMDVVKRSIESLRGNVEIQSRHGVGTTVVITLPLTLAIIEGLLVDVGTDCFVLPLSVVEECIELTREDVRKAHNRRLATVRGKQVPYVRLREWFGITGDLPEVEQIVITDVDGMRLGFVVDNVIGQHQTVIKSLGRIYQDIDGLSGATILGDGTVALIVDVGALIRTVTRDQDSRAH